MSSLLMYALRATISLSAFTLFSHSALADESAHGLSDKDGPQFLFGANLDLLAATRNFGPQNGEQEILLRELEVSLESKVRPWLYGLIFLTRPSGGSVAIEEVAMIADLPLGLRLKAGDFRNEFGLLNTIHEPERPQVSLPLPIKEFLGDEQLREGSITLGRSFDLGAGNRAGVSLAVFRAENEVAFNATSSGDKAFASKLYFGHHSDRIAYQFGLSALTGKNDPAGKLTTSMQIADFQFRIDPDFNTETDYPARFIWMGEVITNQREISPGITNRAFGFWSVADYQFRQRHHFGIGVEYTEGLFDNTEKVRAYSAHYSWFYSRHARLQLQARQINPDIGSSGVEVMLQFNFVFRPHSERTFLTIM